MAGYTRQSSATIVTEEIVEAAPLNAEFNQLQSAFDETTGHAHDGTAGEGPTIPLIADADADTKIHTETNTDEDIIRVTIAGTELLQIGANSLRKATGSTVGLGSTLNRFDTAFVSALTASAASVDRLTVSTGGSADFSGNVLSNVGTSATATDAANVGYVDAKIVSSNLAGVTTNALVVGSGGTTDFNSVRLSEVGTPTVATDAATKGYTDDAIAGQLGGLAGPVSTTDNGIVLWDGTAGGAVQNSPWTLDPTTGVMTPGGTDPSITDLVVSDTATFEGLTTVSAAGEHAEENDANATGTVTIQATDPTVLRRTLTGDVTLLVAGAPTPGYRNPNLLTYSEQFDNAAWTKTNATISADSTSAPDGRTTADKLVEASDTGQAHAVGVTGVTIVTATAYTFSVYAKQAERTKMWVQPGNTGFPGAPVTFFDLSAGTVISAGSGVTASIEAADEGFYRCIVTLTSGGTTANVSIGTTAVSGQTHNGDGTSGLYLWGAQLVEGSDPLVYRSVEAIRQAYGYGWSTELRTTQDGTGGRDLTILPANLLTYSEQFDNAAWTKSRATISADAIAAPDGRTTADKFVEDGTASQTHQMSRGVSVTSGTPITLSVYAKAAERSRLSTAFTNAGAFSTVQRATFDLSTGIASSTQGTPTVAIEALSGGYYRCSITATPTSTATATSILYLDNGSTAVYTGDGSSGLYLWGAQLVVGSDPLGYIGVGATRAASVVWRGGTAAEIDYASQAAAAESRIIIGVGSDGEILIDDVSVET
jgi:hypothetical protein